MDINGTNVHPGISNQEYELPRMWTITVCPIDEFKSIMNNILNAEPESVAINPANTNYEDATPAETTGSKLMSFWPRLGQIDSDIKEFLSRPVKIYVGTTTDADFHLSPMQLFCSNPTVSRKLANYHYIRATIAIRYSEIAIPFVYGCRQIAAVPMATDVTSRYINAYDLNHLNCIYTNPSTTSSYEMRLPFLWRYPYQTVNIDALSTTNNWSLKINNVVPYRRSDSATVPANSVSIYAWLEDVELDGTIPTNVIYQSEYKGVISEPASIFADAASTLSKIPVLAPLTRPVEHASKMLAQFSKALGFSKPIQLEPPAPYFNNPDHNMAVSTYLDSCQKLTIDPKQSVTVGTGMFDNSMGDNLAFGNFFKKEAYVWQFPWTTGNVVGSVLLNTPVTPAIASPAGLNFFSLPPCGIPILPFRFWRGGMRYRFRVVCSSFHRGRLRFFWSPYQLDVSSEGVWNQVQSVVVDIESETEVVIDVNYAFRDHYKRAVFQTPQSHDGDNTCNGYLYCRVSQELTAPLSSADCVVLMYASALDDMEVAGKSGLNMRMFHLFPNSTITPAPLTTSVATWPNEPTLGSPAIDPSYQSMQVKPKSKHATFNIKAPSDFNAQLNSGQRITSFRELNRSYQLWEVNTLPTSTGNHVSYISFPPNLLLPGGVVTTPSSVGLRLYDNSLTVCTSIFRFMRGSLRWKIVFNCDVSGMTFKVELIRQPSMAGYRLGGTYTMGAYPTNGNALSQNANNGIAIVTDGHTITFEIPYENYSSWISLPNTGTFAAGYNNALLSVYNANANVTAPNLTYSAYVSAGEDLDFGVPVGYGRAYLYDVFRTVSLLAPEEGVGVEETKIDEKENSNELQEIIIYKPPELPG